MSLMVPPPQLLLRWFKKPGHFTPAYTKRRSAKATAFGAAGSFNTYAQLYTCLTETGSQTVCGCVGDACNTATVCVSRRPGGPLPLRSHTFRLTPPWLQCFFRWRLCVAPFCKCLSILRRVGRVVVVGVGVVVVVAAAAVRGVDQRHILLLLLLPACLQLPSFQAAPDVLCGSAIVIHSCDEVATASRRSVVPFLLLLTS